MASLRHALPSSKDFDNLMIHRQWEKDMKRTQIGPSPVKRLGGKTGNGKVNGDIQSGQNVIPSSFQSSILRHLSQIPELDAIFLFTDMGAVVHVYSVANEYESKIYDQLLKKERLIEKDFPETVFEFHLRAHQGRKPSATVPIGSASIFLR